MTFDEEKADFEETKSKVQERKLRAYDYRSKAIKRGCIVVQQFKTGMRFGRLTLRQKTRESPKISHTIRKQWICDCDCGTRQTVPQYYLIRSPNPKVNCGECPDLKSNKTLFNREYRIWLMMLMRTTDPRHVSYKHYGARGIRVCPEWSDPETGFDAFLAHIGPRPSERHSVDRYPDPDGWYRPGNVRWATAQQQAENKSKLPKGSDVTPPEEEEHHDASVDPFPREDGS